MLGLCNIANLAKNDLHGKNTCIHAYALYIYKNESYSDKNIDIQSECLIDILDIQLNENKICLIDILDIQLNEYKTNIQLNENKIYY